MSTRRAGPGGDRESPAQHSHPARSALIDHGRALPTAWKEWDAAREAAGVGPGDTPAGQAELDMMRRLIAGRGSAARKALAEDASGRWMGMQTLIYRCLSIWRYTQGIYRFDADVYAAVCNTPLDGEIPGNILRALPEWTVYLETPGLQGFDGPIYGAWVGVAGLPHGEGKLQITTLMPHGRMELAVVSLGDGSSLKSQIVSTVERLGGDAEDVEKNLAYLVPIINLALYLCARPEDITGKRGSPGNPGVASTKRGERLFPAAAETSWDVGVRMGTALRLAAQAQDLDTPGGIGETGRGVRGHVRRAHWHTVLSGPRLRADGSAIPPSSRKAELRWLPPIAVALNGPDDLAAVVRKVR